MSKCSSITTVLILLSLTFIMSAASVSAYFIEDTNVTVGTVHYNFNDCSYVGDGPPYAFYDEWDEDVGSTDNPGYYYDVQGPDLVIGYMETMDDLGLQIADSDIFVETNYSDAFTPDDEDYYLGLNFRVNSTNSGWASQTLVRNNRNGTGESDVFYSYYLKRTTGNALEMCIYASDAPSGDEERCEELTDTGYLGDTGWKTVIVSGDFSEKNIDYKVYNKTNNNTVSGTLFDNDDYYSEWTNGILYVGGHRDSNGDVASDFDGTVDNFFFGKEKINENDMDEIYNSFGNTGLEYEYRMNVETLEPDVNGPYNITLNGKVNDVSNDVECYFELTEDDGTGQTYYTDAEKVIMEDDGTYSNTVTNDTANVTIKDNHDYRVNAYCEDVDFDFDNFGDSLYFDSDKVYDFDIYTPIDDDDNDTISNDVLDTSAVLTLLQNDFKDYYGTGGYEIGIEIYEHTLSTSNMSTSNLSSMKREPGVNATSQNIEFDNLKPDTMYMARPYVIDEDCTGSCQDLGQPNPEYYTGDLVNFTTLEESQVLNVDTIEIVEDKTSHSATVFGNVTGLYDTSLPAQAYFRYVYKGRAYDTPTINISSPGTIVNHTINGLNTNSTVQFELQAEQDTVKRFGGKETFTTFTWQGNYTQITGDAYNVNDNSAQADVELTNLSGVNISLLIEYRELGTGSSDNWETTDIKYDVNSDGNYTFNMTGLEPGTTYEYRSWSDSEEFAPYHANRKILQATGDTGTIDTPGEDGPDVSGAADTMTGLLNDNIKAIVAAFIVIGIIAALAYEGVRNPFILLFAGIIGLMIDVVLGLVSAGMLVLLSVSLIIMIVMFIIIFNKDGGRI